MIKTFVEKNCVDKTNPANFIIINDIFSLDNSSYFILEGINGTNIILEEVLPNSVS